MPDKRRHVVCEAMRISQKTHLRLLAEIRKETGTLTKQERFREIVGRVRDWIGDSDARAMSLALASRALSISTSQAGRARDVIVRERMDATEAPRLKLVAKPPLPPPPNRRKVEMLFSVEGDRLFSKNREPAEVGA
jgi:hypothetical protein